MVFKVDKKIVFNCRFDVFEEIVIKVVLSVIMLNGILFERVFNIKRNGNWIIFMIFFFLIMSF